MKYLIAFLLYVITFGPVGVLVALVAFAALIALAVNYWLWILAVVLILAAIDAAPLFVKSRKEEL